MTSIDHLAMKQTLFTLLAEEGKTNVSTIREDLLLENLGVDSFSYVEILMKIEDKFQCRISEEAESMLRIKSVGDMLTLLQSAVPTNGADKPNAANKMKH